LRRKNAPGRPPCRQGSRFRNRDQRAVVPLLKERHVPGQSRRVFVPEVPWWFWSGIAAVAVAGVVTAVVLSRPNTSGCGPNLDLCHKL
jgi:hypothetical protein